MKEKELKELKLTKNIIIPFPNFQQNTIISPTQMNDNFEEIEHAYNTLIDNHNGALEKINKVLSDLISSDNEAISNEQARVQAEEIRVNNEEERINDEDERRAEEKKRIAMYNTHLNDELRREQKHTEMIDTFDAKVSEVNTFMDTKKEEVEEFVTAKGQEVQDAINAIPPKSELIGAKGDKGDKGDTPSITHLETSINNKINEVETRFDALTSKQQQDAEVIDARVGENGKIYASLGSRLNEVDSQLEHKVNIDRLSYINVKDYGLKGNGVVDDTQALKALLLRTDINTKLYFPKGDYIFTDTIDIDCSKYCLVGENGTIFNFNANNKTFLKISSTSHSLASANVLENIKIINKNKTCTAMFLGGDDDGKKCVGVSIKGLMLEGFLHHVIFGDDTFIVQFEKSTFYGWTGNSLSYKDNSINSGENISFTMCSWHDPTNNTSKIFNITFGFFKFSRCSFDYFAQLGYVGGSSYPYVTIENCHIEYGFPHTSIASSTDTALVVNMGHVIISNTNLLWAKSIVHPFAKCINGSIKFDNLAFRLLGLESTNVEYLCEFTNEGMVTYTNTIYDSLFEKTKIKLLNNSGILPNNIDFYTIAGGTVEVINDSSIGDCLSLTSTSTNTVSISTPFIPVNYLDEYLSFYKYKVVNINGGTFYPRFRLYDINKKELGVTQPFGSFTVTNNTDWVEVVPIFKKLTTVLKPQTAFLKISFEIFGHAGAGANAIVSIPYLEKI